ncbi:MAG: hypothetical protein SCK28_13070 [Bacillota bacterium]|nr:hypothetical protein [Bacillota bacterium]
MKCINVNQQFVKESLVEIILGGRLDDYVRNNISFLAASEGQTVMQEDSSGETDISYGAIVLKIDNEGRPYFTVKFAYGSKEGEIGYRDFDSAVNYLKKII